MNLKPSEEVRLKEVIRIGRDRAEEAAKTLCRAFFDDPVFKWLLGESKDKEGDLKIWWSWNMENLPPFTEVHATGDLLGVSIWRPSSDLVKYSKKDLKDFFSLSRQLFGERTRLIEKIAEHFPGGEWWYLSAIGVDPDHFGEGRGGKILEAKLKHLDEDGIPAYLEASTLKSAALYARHGFGELETLDFRKELPDAPLLYPMWRDPK